MQSIIEQHKNTPLFSFDGQTKDVIIYDVYDGDTFTGIFNLENQPYKFKFRMIGYDSPEKKITKQQKLLLNDDQYEFMKKASLKSLDFLKDKLQIGSTKQVQLGPYDKYGRILCTVIIDGVNINEQMINSNLGFKYGGNTKLTILDQYNILSTALNQQI